MIAGWSYVMNVYQRVRCFGQIEWLISSFRNYRAMSDYRSI